MLVPLADRRRRSLRGKLFTGMVLAWLGLILGLACVEGLVIEVSGEMVFMLCYLWWFGVLLLRSSYVECCVVPPRDDLLFPHEFGGICARPPADAGW